MLSLDYKYYNIVNYSKFFRIQIFFLAILFKILLAHRLRIPQIMHMSDKKFILFNQNFFYFFQKFILKEFFCQKLLSNPIFYFFNTILHSIIIPFEGISIIISMDQILFILFFCWNSTVEKLVYIF
jgi:hypothetical protein